MKYYLSSSRSRQNRQAFTLVETVIAMGIITIMITAFLAAFGPAVKGVKKSIAVKDVNRLASTLEYEMSVLRESEVTAHTTAFEKSFEWIKSSAGTDIKKIILL